MNVLTMTQNMVRYNSLGLCGFEPRSSLMFELYFKRWVVAVVTVPRRVSLHLLHLLSRYLVLHRHHCADSVKTVLISEVCHLLQHPTLQKRLRMIMPALAFLARDVHDVIAGAGGLLCVEGGRQPRSHADENDPPYMCDWDFCFPPQSIMVVCNPETENYTFLPPLSKHLESKVARMDLNPSCDKGYTITVVGYNNSQVLERDRPDVEEIVVAIYDSQVARGEWVYWHGTGGLRTNSYGHSSLALIDGVIYLGGEEKWSGHWNSRVLAFDLGKGTWDVQSFLADLEAPKVVECNGCAYAIARNYNVRPSTRASVLKKIRMVVCQIITTRHGYGFEEFTTMPDPVFSIVFEGNSMGEYEYRAGMGTICFFPSTMNDVMCFLDIPGKNWRLTQYPYSEEGVNSLADCVWTPSLVARP